MPSFVNVSVALSQVQCFRSHSISYTPNIINILQYSTKYWRSVWGLSGPTCWECFVWRCSRCVDDICDIQNRVLHKGLHLTKHMQKEVLIYWMYQFMFVFDHLLSMFAQYCCKCRRFGWIWHTSNLCSTWFSTVHQTYTRLVTDWDGKTE